MAQGDNPCIRPATWVSLGGRHKEGGHDGEVGCSEIRHVQPCQQKHEKKKEITSVQPVKADELER